MSRSKALTSNGSLQPYAHKCHSTAYSVAASLAVGLKRRQRMMTLFLQVLVAWVLLAGTGFAQATDPNSTFSDLSPEYDGGVANPTDGSTGNVLQQTLFAAYFWGVAHGGARATVVVSSEYPISGSRILVPGNVDLICSSYAPQTYTGGCRISQTDPGDNTATGGSPLLMADWSIGVLPDHKTWCSYYDNPQQPGCTIISGGGASIRGFTLYGNASFAGGGDIGIRVNSSSVHVQDTVELVFGGPGIQILGGINDSFDWNFGTNVDMWWCAHPSQMFGSIGGLDLGGMIDGEASHNQYSTGCAFGKAFTVSQEYPHLAAMYVSGAGNLIQGNLLQADGIALITAGMEHRIVDNRLEYVSREAIRNIGVNSLFSNNRITSACLDPNLINLRPGAVDNGIPRYPNTPTFLHKGYIIMDPSGNVEQLVSNAGTSGATVPDWSVEPGSATLDGDELAWENMGPWPTNSTGTGVDLWAQPTSVTGVCYAVYDQGGGGNTWSANEVGEEVGVNGPSYLRGSYFITGSPGGLTGNKCYGDLPDAYGNGQCWWGGDLYANGGPAGLASNGFRVAASGGGTAWVGDYSVVVLADNIPRHYSNFQGMSDGQTFTVTSSAAANVIDPWSTDGVGGDLYGHTSVGTCTGAPLVVAPGQYYQFYYNYSSPGFKVQQGNCPAGSAPEQSDSISVTPANVTFGSQQSGTTSVAQNIAVTNTSNIARKLSVTISDDFSETDTCSGSLAAGGSCTISVTFTPTSAGAHAGVLTITSNGSGAAQTVSLTGLGSAPSSAVAAITLSASSSSLNVSSSGQATATTVTVVPRNGFVGTVNLKCQISSVSPSTQVAPPTCSLSPAQIVISNNTAAVSTLVISTPTSTVAATRRKVAPLGGMSLAALSLLGLLPFRALRRKSYIIYLSLMLAVGMIGCGYTPTPTQPTTPATPSAGSYKVVITADGGNQPATSINISLQVQ